MASAREIPMNSSGPKLVVKPKFSCSLRSIGSGPSGTRRARVPKAFHCPVSPGEGWIRELASRRYYPWRACVLQSLVRMPVCIALRCR